MAESIVSFQVATLAKEKGFDIKTVYHYPNISEKQDICLKTDWNNFTDMSGNSNYQSAPTQALLQKWLRERHNIQIHIDHSLWSREYSCKVYISNGTNMYPSIIKQEDFKTYEEALEVGLLEALKLIKEN